MSDRGRAARSSESKRVIPNPINRGVNMVSMSRGEVQKDMGETAMIVPASEQVESKIEEEGEQLLPGVPDEITLDQIAPKLPWTAFYILSSVSRGWQRAIQSHQVYDARVRSKSTQTLVGLIDRSFDEVGKIGLFSTADGSCYHVPPIPGVKNGIPWACECISLDGKLYVFGGIPQCYDVDDDEADDDDEPTADVYVLDLAGQRQWKQCASMKDARFEFSCDANDGKIYVFGGGSYETGRVWAAEVYDPQNDTWSPIMPLPSFRNCPKVTSMGQELFLYGGTVYIPEWKRFTSYDPYLCRRSEFAFYAEVYHPHTNRWRTLEHFTESHVDKVLMVGGKLHKLNPCFIESYDIHTNSWQDFQPISFGVSEPSHFSIHRVLVAVPIEDEVLAMVEWRMIDEEDEEVKNDGKETRGTCLIKSQGVGGKNTQIVWQRLECSIPVDCCMPLLCPIQL